MGVSCHPMELLHVQGAVPVQASPVIVSQLSFGQHPLVGEHA